MTIKREFREAYRLLTKMGAPICTAAVAEGLDR